MEIPPEILEMIAYGLPVRDITRLCRTNSSFSWLCNDQRLWYLLVRRDFPYYSGTPHSWKNKYRKLSSLARKYIYLILTIQTSFENRQNISLDETYIRLWENNSSLVKDSNFYFPEPQGVIYSGPSYNEIYRGHFLAYDFMYFPISYREKGITKKSVNKFFSKFLQARREMSQVINNTDTFNPNYGFNPADIIVDKPLPVKHF